MSRSREGVTTIYKGLSPCEVYMNRIPVKYQGQSLMPMKGSRVQKFIDSGRAKIRYDRKVKIHYLQLLVSPSGIECQDIVIGLDPGSTFDGFSVVSKECHHLNIELIQRPKKGKTSIKSFKHRQAGNRRLRRSRLRHRRIRFSSRTSKKLTPTIRANLEFRQWLILKLVKIYPINKMVVEDVRFNHYAKKNGKSFSHVELGKTALYEFIKSLDVKLELIQGFETHKLRNNSFGIDLKLKEKDSRHFNAHCLDSFVMACPRGYFSKDTEELFHHSDETLEPIIKFNGVVNEKVLFIEKIVKVRRCLTRLRKVYETKNNLIGPRYYRRLNGGIKEVYQNFSSRKNICRVKPNGEHSNHPKNWIYLDHGFAERFKYSEAAYGGTRTNGKSYFKDEEWKNHIISN